MSFRDVALEAVKFRKCFATCCPILQDPEADLLLLGRDIFPFLFHDFFVRLTS